MHGKKKIHTFLKISYIVLQALLFIVGLSITSVSISLFIKERVLLKIPYKVLMYSVLLGLFFISVSIMGFKTILTHKRITMFIYTATTLTLMNFQLLIALKVPYLVEKTELWTSNRWDEISDGQRNFVQGRLHCCGFSGPHDRAGSMCPKDNNGCLPVFKSISKSLRDVVPRMWICSFFIESMSISVIYVLRMNGRSKLRR
jgi:hypothetical protein